MPIPLLPLALVGTGAAALLYVALKPKSSSSGGAPGGKGAAPGGGGGPVAPGGLGSDLPAQLQGPFQQLLTQPGVDPNALDVLSAKLSAYGYTADAAALSARAAALRAVGPTPPVAPVGPTPVVPVGPTPVAPPSPVPVTPVTPPAPGAQSLPVMTYEPDTRPMSDPNAYYYDAANGKHAKIDVRMEANALRFLGYPAPVDPGGSGDMGTDSSQGLGSWNPQLQNAVKLFQTDDNDTVDGWLGPQTIGSLAQKVAAQNAQNAATNQQNNVPNAVFAGRVLDRARRRHGRGFKAGADGRVMTGSVEAHVASPYGLKLRAQPTDTARVLSLLPLGGTVDVVQVVSGPKREVASPGHGGWALVTYGADTGWVPAEWLAGKAA